MNEKQLRSIRGSTIGKVETINELPLNELPLLGEKWLESKIQRMRNLLKIAEPDEALYREIMLSLGYPKNKVQFLELALMTPFKIIKTLGEREKIEKALLYRAGFIDSKEGLPDDFDFSLRMEKSIWNFRGIRPANHPEKRIKGISYLLSETSSCGLVDFFVKRLNEGIQSHLTPKKAQNYVNKIMDFKGVGIQRKREMFFNIILPFSIASLENKNSEVIKFLNTIFSTHPPLSENSITKRFKSFVDESTYDKLNVSTKTYFGIHLFVKEKLR
ncbi:MAG: DUF2851 family protein [Fervidobacterium sp.]